MAKAGRKRKAGSREKNGRLSRAGIDRFDKGTEHAQIMRELYGTDCTDAIGRAYRSGLLGEGTEAKTLLDLGRAIHNAYWSTYGTGRITCTLGERTGGSVVSIDSVRAKKREDWLNACLSVSHERGDRHRKSFYQLVIDVHPDCGPDWLDRLLPAAKHTQCIMGVDGAEELDRALCVLRDLAS